MASAVAIISADSKVKEIRPQPGLQTKFLSSPADIVIGGGTAGSSKTFSLLMEALRHVDVPGFGAVIFRRESPQITNQGGLWDESENIYTGLYGAKANRNELSWVFYPAKAKIRFSHMQLTTDRFNWDGSQIPLIGFDQLESFEEIQFWYMLSRNRTTCGVRPYVRGTCNPVPEDDPTGGWLCKLIAWWIDQETGYPIKERSGKIRWFVRRNEVIHWADSRQALIEMFPDAPAAELEPKSFTFIAGTLADNPILTTKDPGYRGNLLALSLVERERLLAGNWKIKPSAGKVFNRTWFKTLLQAVPQDINLLVRYWDKAGTEGGGAYSAGALMGRRANGRFILLNITRGQWSANSRETMIKQTAASDSEMARTLRCPLQIWVEQEPGSGGKESAENTTINLAGYSISLDRVTGSKLTRAMPASAQAEAGNIDLMDPLGATLQSVTALEAFLTEAQNFNGVTGVKDQVDAFSGAFNHCALARSGGLVW
jgi:predicted phage terminase large subunit-like protein